MAKRKIILTGSQIDEATTLWKAGVTIGKMAAQLSVPSTFLSHFIYSNRDFFPMRRDSPRVRVDKVRLEPEEIEIPAIERVVPPDRVIRFTREGAKVTMPRVTFIDGPAP